MKKISHKVLASFIFLMILSGLNPLLKVSAQGRNMLEAENDRRLAESLKVLTNRSTDGLVEQRDANGGSSVDLQGRFQNVMLGRIKTDGEPMAGCVTSLGEANLFFERNLETGIPLPNDFYRTESLDEVAARHGMSKKEYLFYINLIAKKERESLSPSSSTITIVNNDGVGEGFNDATAVSAEGGNTGTTRGQQRLNLFNFAADIWEAFLDSNVTINVQSQFNSLTPCSTSGGVLGSAGTVNLHRNFLNAGLTNTWHHAALANKQAGSDLVPANPEINATFNSDVDTGCLGVGSRFYYGLDNATPSQRINLLVVLLHEMGHGLGFSSFVNGSTGVLFTSGTASPDVYTTYMFDRSVSLFWNSMTNAQRVTSGTNTNNVLWDGANVRNASSFLTAGRDAATGRVELFTPNPLQSGSSISHFSNAATTNLLMEPAINAGLPLTLDLTRQQMRDIGWYRDTNADLVPDTITGVTPSGGTLVMGSTATVNWTNNGGFLRNVIVELSTDGGATFPTVLGSGVTNSFGFASFTFTVPNTPTSQGRIRVREDNFLTPSGISAANFNIQPLLAANVSVSGRVTASNGKSISRARVSLIDEQGNSRTVQTNAFGYFSFEEVEAGRNYTIQTTAKGFQFQPQVISINEEISGLVITAE